MITREWPMIRLSDEKLNNDRGPIQKGQNRTVVGLS